jgi:signal peptidase I
LRIPYDFTPSSIGLGLGILYRLSERPALAGLLPDFSHGIGMPGDTIRYENDKLYINDKETDEPYLADYIKRFKDDKLQSTYSGKGFEGNKGTFFRSIAEKAQAFTVDVNYNTNFSFTVPEGEYLLLGDDRLVSSDSRHVGTFKAKDITGEAKFRFWPITRIGTF